MGNLPFQKIKKKKKNKKNLKLYSGFYFFKVIPLKTIQIALIFHTLP